MQKIDAICDALNRDFFKVSIRKYVKTGDHCPKDGMELTVCLQFAQGAQKSVNVDTRAKCKKCGYSRKETDADIVKTAPLIDQYFGL